MTDKKHDNLALCAGTDCNAPFDDHSVQCKFEHFLSYTGYADLPEVEQDRLARAFSEGVSAKVIVVQTASDDSPAKRAAKLVGTAIWIILACIMIFVITLDLVLRFAGDEVFSFYSEKADATCVVVRESGQRTMHCMEGYRAESAE